MKIVRGVYFMLFALVGLVSWSSFELSQKNKWNAETPVYEVLAHFGEDMPEHARNNAKEEIIQRGYELIHRGRTIGPDGKKSKYISKFYVCTSCHNTQREDPDLTVLDPEARLNHAIENKLKFLQGTTFYGVANRESWYNDDYYLKYGDLVRPANKSLAEATQLCATVCSSGRYLEEWELEAILAYYWDNQIKLGDLALTPEEKSKILKAEAGENPNIIALIKSKYALKSPATFGKSPDDKKKGYPYEGNPELGKQLFQLSCQACHQREGVAGLAFEADELDFNKFKRNLYQSGLYNLYDIVRYGTYTDKGKPRYMPHYPEERMSDRQLEHLRAYILQVAG